MTKIKEDERIFTKNVQSTESVEEKVDAKETGEKAAPKSRKTRSKRKT